MQLHGLGDSAESQYIIIPDARGFFILVHRATNQEIGRYNTIFEAQQEKKSLNSKIRGTAAGEDRNMGDIVKAKKEESIEEWLKQELPDKLSAVLPKTLTPERIVRVALTAMLKTPALKGCTKASLLQCIIQSSSMGLEPDGRRAHLIPYNDNKTGKTICTLIVDYKGMVELVRRSGEVSDIHADVVCDGDQFDYQYGTGSHLIHRPALKRGKVMAAYSYVKLRDGSEAFDVMSVEEVNDVRKRSRAANKGPWMTDWNEMAKKTVFRRHSKWLPFSSEIRTVIEADDDNIIQTMSVAPPKQFVSMPSAEPEPQALPDNSPVDTQAESVPPQQPQGNVDLPHQLDMPEKDMKLEHGLIEKVEAVEGEKAGKKYTRYFFHINGVKLASFDKKLYENGQYLSDNQFPVNAYYTVSKFGNTLEGFEMVQEDENNG